MLNILGCVSTNISELLFRRRQREWWVKKKRGMQLKAKQNSLTFLVGSKTRGDWQEENVDTTLAPHRVRGAGGAAGSFAPRQTAAAVRNIKFFFFQPRSFSKEALNSTNLPRFHVDDSGRTAMSTNCHPEQSSAHQQLQRTQLFTATSSPSLSLLD